MTGAPRRFTAVLENVPHCNHGGGGITAFAALKAMRDRGHEVSIIALSPDPKPGNDERHVADLRAMGIETRVLAGPPKSLSRPGRLASLVPSRERLFPGLSQRAEVAGLLRALRPDAVFMYHWNALAAVHGLRDFPKFATVGDPAHLPFLFRSSLLGGYEAGRSLKKRVQAALHRALQVPALVRLQHAMLAECQARGAFAAHHAEMFARAGGFRCDYLRTPTPDPLPARSLPPRAGRFKIMHIGHLQGIATLAGVEMLVRDILPRLRTRLPPDSFEVHLVGGFFETMPAELQAALRADSAVRIRGQVTPADDEFLSSDILLVPTPIELGIRVRIITGFSFGSCIVAHEANRKGIPELEDGVNALVGGDGASLADACARVYADPALKAALGRKARETYEAAFSLEAAGGALCRTMDELAGARAVPETTPQRGR
jgi:glycosyltransferase involved in cell wall biosynthesis